MRLIIIRKKKIMLILNSIIALTVAVSLGITVIAVERGGGDNMMPLTQIRTKSNILALTVNVYENTDTEALLEALGKIKATFFISESFQESYPEKVKFISERGHSVGILLDYESDCSEKELYDILAARIERLARLIGKNAELVRYDNKAPDDSAVENICSVGLLPVQWAEYDGKLSDGKILLLTDLKTTEEIIEKTVAEGFLTATVDELISKQ